MSDAAITLITGLLTLIGVCVTAWASAKKTRDAVSDRLVTAQAVTDAKLDALAREVREHNNFARRMPVAEEQIRALDRRLTALERGGRP